MDRMIREDELNRMTLIDIQKEINTREKLLEQMVGNFYPSILWSELDQLVERRTELIHVQ
jgi:hypothetical protein